MTDRTIEIIKTVKMARGPWNKAIIEYLLKEHNSTPDEYPDAYSEYILNEVMKSAYLDYIKSCDNPNFEVLKLLEHFNNYGGYGGMYSLGSIIASLFQSAQVCKRTPDGIQYVNGFDERIEHLLEDKKEEENNG